MYSFKRIKSSNFSTWDLWVVFYLNCLCELIEYKAVLVLGLCILCLTNFDYTLANFITIAYYKYAEKHINHLAKERPLHA